MRPQGFPSGFPKPCASEIVTAREYERVDRQHVERLGRAQPEIRMEAPESFGRRSKHNAKAHQQRRQRQRVIEEENENLVARMRAYRPFLGPGVPTRERPFGGDGAGGTGGGTAPGGDGGGGILIHHNAIALADRIERQRRSFDNPVRKRERLRIARENRALYERIQQTKPTYANKDLTEHSRLTQKYLDTRRRFPASASGTETVAGNSRGGKGLVTGRHARPGASGAGGSPVRSSRAGGDFAGGGYYDEDEVRRWLTASGPGLGGGGVGMADDEMQTAAELERGIV
eukprot:g2599.t1